MSPRPQQLEYQRAKARARLRSSVMARIGQDIGDIPPVADPERRAQGSSSFRLFCELYFPHRFGLAWSHDHLKVIAKIERAVRPPGALFAVAMPRGSGKTTLCEVAVLFAVLVSGHPFVFLIGSTEDRAVGLLRDIKAELLSNDILAADFPEALYPIRRLEDEARACKGQKHHGQPTFIVWGADRIAFPMIPGSKAAGALIRVSGLTGGNIRGAAHTRPDRQQVRPSLVIIDDPQTDQSARSPKQCADRERTISGAVLGLAGPGRKIAGLMPCTVISRGDLADNLLNREKHPEWQGERTKMCYAFPTNEKLWEEYARLRAESLINDGDGREATDYYRQHRAEMDVGAVPAWPQRFNPDEISAVQHIQNLRLRDEATFWAEYQNEPLPEADAASLALTADEVAGRVNRIPRGVMPADALHLVGFIDVQKEVLYWMVCAWAADFTGYIVDYGTYPDQERAYFTSRDAKRTLARATPGAGMEGAIQAGLDRLTEDLFRREWRREGAGSAQLERCLIDSGWGQTSDLVHRFVRYSTNHAGLMASKGQYIGASSIPFAERKRRPGERIGSHWLIPPVAGRQVGRHVLIDTNYWKSFIFARLAIQPGDKGSLTLFGGRPIDHRLVADHLTAEFPVRTEGRGRAVDEWRLKPGRPDNHWLDCLVGCAVAASVLGAVLPGVGSGPARTRKRYTQANFSRRSGAL